MPAIPISSSEDQKEFLVFYTPPVEAGQPPREFRTRFEIDREFERTLGEGREEKLTYGTRQLAERHELEMTFRVEIDESLGSFAVKPDFALKNDSESVISIDGRTYRVWLFDTDLCRVTGRQELRVRIVPARPTTPA